MEGVQGGVEEYWKERSEGEGEGEEKGGVAEAEEETGREGRE